MIDDLITKGPDNNLIVSPSLANYHLTSSNEFYSRDRDEKQEQKQNYYRLSVEDRNMIWNAARQQKIESLRQMTEVPGIEECTFQPNLITNRATRRHRKSAVNFKRNTTLENNSVQKYVLRMNKAREIRYNREHENDHKPGSGNVWKNKLTVPREPRLRVDSKKRTKSANKNSFSLSKIISIKNLDLNQDISHQPYFNMNSYISTKNRLLGKRDKCEIGTGDFISSPAQSLSLNSQLPEQSKNLTMTTSSFNEVKN